MVWDLRDVRASHARWVDEIRSILDQDAGDGVGVVAGPNFLMIFQGSVVYSDAARSTGLDDYARIFFANTFIDLIDPVSVLDPEEELFAVR